MTIGYVCGYINNLVAAPAMIMFLGIGIFLTLKTRFVQIRAVPRFIKLMTHGIGYHYTKGEKAINPFHALFTAMATTIGMGNIVGPTVAIISGGPGALFWLTAYSFFGSVTKFTEVIFALGSRVKLKNGNIIGGPTQYLREVTPLLGGWYAAITMFLFAGWSAQQANTLASVFALESVPVEVTGAVLALFVFFVLVGGIQRVGQVASKLVPFMFVLYVVFALAILLVDIPALKAAIGLVFSNAFSPCAAVGGFLGATVISAMQQGIHRSIYITEAGLGTSSIAHAQADTDRHQDQAILAMFSVGADTILSILSGLIVLATGMWTRGGFSNTLVYEAFKAHSPGLGKWILLASITLFVLTTVIGNSFNASQSFASFTRYRWMIGYYLVLAILIFCGALANVVTIWKVMDVLQLLVAIPHLAVLFVLSITKGKLLKV